MKRVNRFVVVGVLGTLGLGLSLTWRVHAQRVSEARPSGGSSTVEGTSVVVGARILARLAEVNVLQGDAVHRGQVLAKLDCLDQASAVASSEARVHAADAQVDVARAGIDVSRQDAAMATSQTAQARAQDTSATVEAAQGEREDERADRLYREAALPLLEKERAETRRRETEAHRTGASASLQTTLIGVARARRAVTVAEKQVVMALASAETARADLDAARTRLTECTLVAPQNGIVTERLLEPGSVVQPGTPVFEIVDVSTAKLTFYLPNAELARAKVGGHAQVRVDAYPERSFGGQISRVATEAEFTPRNVQTRQDRDRLVYAIEVRVPNADSALRAGMPAEVVLVDGAP